MTKLLLTLPLLVALVSCQQPLRSAQAQQSPQTVIRDSSGRTTGTVTTDSQGTSVFRDAGGRTTGTASPDSQGTTTFRNDRGTTTGTASSPFPRGR
jgi:hypothetical protein